MNNEKMLPNRCHGGYQTLEKPVISGFSGPLKSFPFYCGGRFGRDIVNNAVDVRHLVDDADADSVQHLVWDAGPIRRHKITGGDAAQRQGVIICPAIALDAHRTHVGQHRKVLVHAALQPGFVDLIPEDEVGLTQNVRLLLGDVADDADGKTGPGKG